MSPIGRVFIVLNLLLAGTFVGFAGTYLQKQDNYKDKLTQEEDRNKKSEELLTQQVGQLERERNSFENLKTEKETKLGAAENQIAQLRDENKRLNETTSSQAADIKKLVSLAESGNTEFKAAFAKAQEAFAQSVAAQTVRDEAVRVKDATVAENRGLTNKIAELTDAVAKRDGDIAALTSDKSQLSLLVKVAETNGFLRAMAAPNLSGMVTTSSGRLCTVQVTDNPGNIDIKQAIESGKFSFAIYDASGYKGEAVAERFEESANAVLCKIFPVKGEIKTGDKAATKTP